MEIKKVAIAIAIDNTANPFEAFKWQVRMDFGEGFVIVDKTIGELKEMLNRIMASVQEIKEKTI